MNMKGRKVIVKKPKANSTTKIQLDKVIGISAKSTSSLAANHVTGQLAYTAAGLIVFYNPQQNKQTNYIINTNSRVFSCLAFSPNGRLLATGEGTCRQPQIVIWENQSNTYSPIRVLKGHKYGIDQVSFSLDGLYLISIGSEHDKGMFVWNWGQSRRLTSNKITKKIFSIAFGPNFFVTAGLNSIKVWSFDRQGRPVTTPSSANAQVKCMASKNVQLAQMKQKNFVAVAVNDTNIFGLTSDGILCVFTMDRLMDKWMDIDAGAGFDLQCVGNLIGCGCKDGVIRIFDASSLEHIVTLPRPPPLGQANITTDRRKPMLSADSQSIFADTIGILLYNNNANLMALYSDRTVFIWDISRMQQVSVSRAFLHHSGAINDLQIVPSATSDLTIFATASADKTIRLWNICHTDPRNLQGYMVRNVYSRELSRIIYVTGKHTHFKANAAQQDDDGNIKCIRTSKDGQFIASGDITGQLRVYRLTDLELVQQMPAHDSDIVCLDYTGMEPLETKSEGPQPNLLATGSRDRLVHVFDADQLYRPILTIDDHSSSISDICFARIEGETRLITCGADKALIFRTFTGNSIQRNFQYLEKTQKMYSIKAHPVSPKIVIGGDKAVKIWNVQTGKVEKTIQDYNQKGVRIAADSNVKVSMDQSGMLIAVCNTDRNLRVFDFTSNRLIAKLNVGEITTGAVFSPNGRKLISTSADGCIFIWKLSPDLSNAIKKRLQKLAPPIPEPKPEQVPIFQAETPLEIPQVPKQAPKPIQHNSLLPRWAQSNVGVAQKKPQPIQNQIPFEVYEDPIPGNESVKPINLEIEEENPIVLSDRNKVIDQFQDEVSEQEEKLPEDPVVISRPVDRNKFTVTRSMIKIMEEESPREEEFYDAEQEFSQEEKLPDFDVEESIKRAPLRESLSSSFWLKKQDQQKKEEKKQKPKQARKKQEAQQPFFQFEPIQFDPGHLPKVMDFKQKKKSHQQAQNQILDAKKRLEQIGLLNLNEKRPWFKQSRSQKNLPKPVQKQAPPQVSSSAKPPKAVQSSGAPSSKYDSQFEAVRNSHIIQENISISMTESIILEPQKQNRFTQGFRSLRASLQTAKSLLQESDINDPEYSMSIQESREEINQINTLLSDISKSLGGSLLIAREFDDADRIEKYSNQLVQAIQEKLSKQLLPS